MPRDRNHPVTSSTMLSRQAVDDASLPRVALLDEREQLRAGGPLIEADEVADVRTVEAGDDVQGVRAEEAIADLRPGPTVRRRGQGDTRDPREALPQQRQADVVRAEVVAPLRDAVRLIDGEERRLDLVEQREEAVG
jgi:hypothetical protein